MAFQDLERKEKIEHIWIYYKWSIIGGVILLFIIGSLLNTFIFHPAPTVILDITIRGEQADLDYIPVLEKELTDLLVNPAENESILIEFLQTGEHLDPTTRIAGQTKFAGKAAAGSLDIVLIGEGLKDVLVQEDFLLVLEGVNCEEAKVAEPTGKSYVLDIAYYPKLRKLIPKGDKSYYVGIYTASQHTETVLKLLNILGEEKAKCSED